MLSKWFMNTLLARLLLHRKSHFYEQDTHKGTLKSNKQLWTDKRSLLEDGIRSFALLIHVRHLFARAHLMSISQSRFCHFLIF